MAESIFTQTAAKFEPKLRKALINAWNQLRTQESRAAIERALVEGGVEVVLSLFDNMGVVLDAHIGDILDDAIRAGGTAAATAIPTAALLNVDFRYDMFNPATVDFVRNYKLNLIQTITDNTREAVRNSLIEDTIAGKNPRVTARNFRNTIGLTPKQEQAVRNYDNFLRNLDREALNRQLRDKRFDRTLLRAIDSDTPLTEAQIQKMTNRYREKYIKYRSEVIARTESLRAVSIGNQSSIRQMIDNGDVDYNRVRKFWVSTAGPRTRDAHRNTPRLNPDGRLLDEPFQTPLGPLMFPRDPNGSAANTIQCRCTVRYEIISPQEVV